MSMLFKAQLRILLQETKSILTDRVGFFQAVWDYGGMKWYWREDILVNRKSVNKVCNGKTQIIEYAIYYIKEKRGWQEVGGSW